MTHLTSAAKLVLVPIDCPHCKTTFEPTASERARLDDFTARGLLVALTCIRCQSSIFFNDQRPASEPTPLRCPVRRCSGWTTPTSDGASFGCGACGHTWQSKRDLDAAILRAIDMFPYRRECYAWKRGTFVAQNDGGSDYAERVESE